MTYHSFDGRKVLMGNNTVCKAVGIGTMKIKMHNGMIQTLMEVRHMPDLRKSLLSIEALAGLGCKMVMEADRLKISKGSLVVMKGKKVRNLYLLKGHTVMGEASMASGGSSEEESIRLWHLRLGHASERLWTFFARGSSLRLVIGGLIFARSVFLGRQQS